MSRTALVTGGAGYIGAHLVRGLEAQGWRVVVLDDLSTGRARDAVPPTARFVLGDVGDAALVRALFEEVRPQAVLHLAAFTSAPASVAEPLRCYRANVETSRVLIEAVVGVPSPPIFVFSSSAAVYGSSDQPRVSETTPATPINPYGASKLMTERMLADAGAAYGLRHVSLRYFNVVGRGACAAAGGRAAAPGSLLDVALQVARGERTHVPVFGPGSSDGGRIGGAGLHPRRGSRRRPHRRPAAGRGRRGSAGAELRLREAAPPCSTC